MTSSESVAQEVDVPSSQQPKDDEDKENADNDECAEQSQDAAKASSTTEPPKQDAMQNGGTHADGEMLEDPDAPTLMQALSGLFLGIVCVLAFMVFGQGYDLNTLMSELGIMEVATSFSQAKPSPASPPPVVPAPISGCPAGYVLRDGDVPGGDSFGRGFDNRKESMDACKADCDARRDCLSYEYSASLQQCYLNKVAVPATQAKYGDFQFCAKVDVSGVGNPECWVQGFDYQICCDQKHGPTGNPQCWDAIFTYARCCFPKAEL